MEETRSIKKHRPSTLAQRLGESLEEVRAYFDEYQRCPSMFKRFQRQHEADEARVLQPYSKLKIDACDLCGAESRPCLSSVEHRLLCVFCYTASARLTYEEALRTMCNVALNVLGDVAGTPVHLPLGICGVSYEKCKSVAESRLVAFDLSPMDYIELTCMACFYCRRPSNDEERNGIDRIDPRHGYQEDNCVPACMSCLRLRSGWDVAFMLEKSLNVFRRYGSVSQGEVKGQPPQG